MNARKDFEKILSYAKSHGIKVVFRRKRKNQKDSAWILFNSKTIVITYRLSDPFKELCASLLHELCHLVAYSLDKNAFKDYFRCYALEKPTMEERRVLYLREKSDIALMPKLHKLLRLEAITIGYIKYHRDFDTWQFYFYMKKGRFPTHKEMNEKAKYFRKKWANDWRKDTSLKKSQA